MNRVTRRCPNRPRFEVLEARSLLNATGAPDPAFNGTGYSSIPFPLPVHNGVSAGLTSMSVVTAPSGQVVVSGTITTPGTPGFGSVTLAIAELNANGTPDTGFGAGGQEQLPLYPSSVPVAAVQANGQILEAVFGTPDSSNAQPLIVVRLNANGTLDTTFGTNGAAIFPSDSANSSGAEPLSTVEAMVVQSNGQIVLVGSAGTSTSSAAGQVFAAMRLDANGSLDTAYGQGGIINVPVAAPGDETYDDPVGAALQADGQVVVVGEVNTGGVFTETKDVGVFRLTTNGTLDTTYGGASADGKVLLPPVLGDPDAAGVNSASGVAIQPTTGDVLISGYDQILSGSSQPSGNSLYRLNTDGTVDSTFGTDGRLTPTVAGAVVAQADGSIDVAGSTYPAAPNSSDTEEIPAGPIYVAQLNADGTPDTSFGNPSTPGLYPPLTPLFYQPSPLAYGNVSTLTLAIQPTDGDILLAGIGSVPALAGPNYGFTVAALDPSASTGPAATPIPTPPAAFDGSGLTDLSVYDPASGTLYYRIDDSPSIHADQAIQFGSAGVGQTIPAAADYQGTGKTQVAVYLTAGGVYAIQPTATSPGLFMQFGSAGVGQTIPVPADYEGTGQADVAVYLTASGTFAILPSNGSPGKVIQLGTSGAGQSIPAPADYYGTGQDDVAVYLAASGSFAVLDPTGKTSGEVVPFGMPGLGNSIPVPGDYDGSGHTEFAVYIPSQGAFYYRPYGGGNDVEVKVGLAGVGEIPVPGDYDGVGHDEFAIYDPTSGFFEYAPANGGRYVITSFGTANNGTLPVAAPAGALPAFNGSGSGGNSAIRPEVVAPVSSAPAPASAITLGRSSAVPSGPVSAPVRAPLVRVNQASPDPFDLG